MYKHIESGVEWIGAIPSDWSVMRMKNCIAQHDGGAWGNEKQGDSGDVICLRVADFDYSKLRFIDAEEYTFRNYDAAQIEKLKLLNGDILVEKSGGGEKTPVGRAVLFDKDFDALYANFLERIRVNHRVLPKFLLYVLSAFYGNGYIKNYIKQTTGIQNLDLSTMLASEFIAVPTIVIQQHIADYLDAKCAKIDALIAKQQEIIEKLKAYKLSVITEAVAPKPEWIKGHLGYVAMFKNGLNYSGVSTDAKIKFLGVGDFQRHFRMDNPEMFSTLEFDGEMPDDLLLKNGDIVFVRSNGSKELVGRSVLIDNVDFPLTYSGFCIRMRNIRQDIVLNEFLMYCFWSHDFRQNLNRDSRGSNINNLNQELLSKLTIAFPSVSEQKEIISYLDKKCIDIERTIISEQAIISKLTEYKKSFIYEVVTGKREV